MLDELFVLPRAPGPVLRELRVNGAGVEVVVLGQRSRPASGDGRRCEGAGRKKAGTPLLDKPATSELGGVSPTIVLPGGWSEADLRYQVEHIATVLAVLKLPR
ncbi:hypothetical protein [Streptomyces massasporeus]|uniref:hypothetical protein n=1 Tax=Streptomyces massasporeus TaxID=67324 RepID=UPI003660ABF7